MLVKFRPNPSSGVGGVAFRRISDGRTHGHTQVVTDGRMDGKKEGQEQFLIFVAISCREHIDWVFVFY